MVSRHNARGRTNKPCPSPPSWMRVIELYLGTLPLGYAIVTPLFKEPLTWRDFWAMALLIVVWPLTLAMILFEGGR